MGSWMKVFLLLLLNILIAALSLYSLNFMHIIDYRTILQKGIIAPKAPPRVEDPLLLEREELAKKWELLGLKTTELSNTISSVEGSNVLLQQDREKLVQDQEAFQNQIALGAAQTAASNDYNVRISEVAAQIAGMPPLTAAEILNLQDDLQVVDTFRKMDELAVLNGQASTVPYLLTLLNRDKAARIQALMVASPTP